MHKMTNLPPHGDPVDFTQGPETLRHTQLRLSGKSHDISKDGHKRVSSVDLLKVQKEYSPLLKHHTTALSQSTQST